MVAGGDDGDNGDNVPEDVFEGNRGEDPLWRYDDLIPLAIFSNR